ncbi:uncharacterized protein [Euphorbia lathyris]|uniref:uncharacterized protein n=1 Tax=Euphorbia lathyris TaxID=212925 RepID=UPI003313A012
MDYFSIFSDEFSHLPTEKQDEEIGKLFILLGGIRIRRDYKESDEDFRIRTFLKGLEKLPDDSEYEGEFFENRIIPSLIDDFKESSVDTQEKLMDKVSELTDGLSIKRKSDESERRYRIRFYSKLLRKLPEGSEFEMVEFARQMDESDEESEGESDEDDSVEDSEEESTSTRSDRGLYRSRSFRSKGYAKRREKSVSEGGSVSEEDLGGDTEPVEIVEWNDGRKKAGFNPKLKLKGNPSPKSKPYRGRK